MLSKATLRGLLFGWRFWNVVLVIALAQSLIYFGALGALIASREYGSSSLGTTALDVLTRILGAPLMYLAYLPPSTFGHTRWWGDDRNFILGLAGLNALGWGVALGRMFRWWSRRGEVLENASALDPDR